MRHERHRLLRRQLTRHLEAPVPTSGPLHEFIDAVDRAYVEADSDRALLERSLEITSRELLERNEELTQAMARERERHEAALEQNRALVIEGELRRQAEEALDRQRAFLRQIIDLNPNLIFAKDRAGRFTLVNQAVAEIYSSTVDALVGKTDADFNSNAEEVEAFRQMDLAVMDSRRERFIPEEQVTDARGRVRWFQTVKRPILGADGEADQILGVATDITERRDAAAHGEAMQRELMSVSRMAGMAEVATGMLHNVGNVLNSLNISVSVVDDHLRGSKVPALARCVKVFQNHPGGLAAFLTTEKGTLLPQFLAAISEHLTEQHGRMQVELEAVARHVEHIKAIVVVQQAYARVSGVVERIDLIDVLDHALGIDATSFARHSVNVVKDYGELPPIETDRHKLLQILVNLVSNARHSLKECSGDDRRLIIGARRTETGIAISVQDTGIGISAEHLPCIFQHGFTTKPGGHGFGLHASANAARELGGTLTVASEGPRRGATFTLELPLARPEKSHGVRN